MPYVCAPSRLPLNPSCGPSPKVVTASTTSAPAGSGSSGATGSDTTLSPATTSSATLSPAAAPPPAGGWQLVVTYVYDGIGNLTAAYGPDPTHPYWELEGLDARDQVTEAVEAGGADSLTHAYDEATGELIETGVADGSTWILHQEYGYDVYGDRVSRGDLVTPEAAGGSFVGGFAGAFSGAVMEPGLSYGSLGQDVLSATIASVVGGGVSLLSGGSFANGAWSAAFQQMFNAVAHIITAADYAYGEIRNHAIESNGQSPPGLANAVASIGAVCVRNGGGCTHHNGSGSVGLNGEAWHNIEAAKNGKDESNGANFMCVNMQQCTYVRGVRTLVRRPMPLPPVGEVTIPTSYNGPLTIYFYNVPYQGWLTRNDYFDGPPKP